jgi:cell division protein FtsX
LVGRNQPIFCLAPFVVAGLFFGLAAFGPTMFLGVWVYIRFFLGYGWRFRPYGDSLFFKRQKK